jgi:LruC domain-containing protein
MNKKIVFLVVAALLVSTFIIVQAAPPLTGAIFTTTVDGTVVNENTRYQSKQDVYLDGGPGPNAPSKAAGLPRGDYYFQVTDPSGKDLLSSDHISCRKIHVNKAGVIDHVYGGTNYVWNDGTGQWDSVSCKHNQGVDVDHSDLGAITVQLYPYDDTPNRGGEYKAWATSVEDYAGDPNFVPEDEGDAVNGENYQPANFHGFIPAKSKTDNYKVRKVRIPTVIDIDVDKTAEPTEVDEPGGEVTFFVNVRNDSPVDVTLDSLVDSIHGDLNGQGDCSVPQSLAPGESYECSFKAMVEGNGGDSETDVVTGCAVDNEENRDCDKDDATVTIRPVLPKIRVEKSASPTLVTIGANVTFSVVVHNESNEPLTLTKLDDDIYGNIADANNPEIVSTGCSVPQPIAVGGNYSCEFVVLVEEGDIGDTQTDWVEGCAVDDDENRVCDKDDATIEIVFSPICPKAIEFTVGYEDIPLNSQGEDYDYNDWITDILIELTYVDEVLCNVASINFVITPEARGAEFDHAFNILFPPDVFDSDGETMLTKFDTDGNKLTEQQWNFTANQINDYPIFEHTSSVFDNMKNTIEENRVLFGEPVAPNMTAELTINFDPPSQFNILDYDLEDPHGANMFFDPYINVHNVPGHTVHAGEVAILTVPLVDWLYSQEWTAIYVSYPLVQFDAGPPVELFFPMNWFEDHNDCVYNGIPCTP